MAQRVGDTYRKECMGGWFPRMIQNKDERTTKPSTFSLRHADSGGPLLFTGTTCALQRVGTGTWGVGLFCPFAHSFIQTSMEHLLSARHCFVPGAQQ